MGDRTRRRTDPVGRVNSRQGFRRCDRCDVSCSSNEILMFRVVVIGTAGGTQRPSHESPTARRSTARARCARRVHELAQGRYKGGIDLFLTTLVSQRALYGAKNSLVSTQLGALVNRITLYRVLGGGLR